MSRRPRFVHLVLLGLLCAGTTLRAQVIRGRVSSADAPLADVLVIVTDTTGAKLAESLVDETGHFAIGLRSSGRYVLRAQRIGFNSATTAPFSVRSSETVVRNLSMTVHPFSLNSIVINAGNRCVVKPAEGEAAARVWDEVRKSLEVTRLASSRRMLFTIAQSVRARKPGGDVVNETTARRRGASENPFFSASPDSLARFGYVHLSRVPTDSSIFYAPDATVLLSESFVATHCLRTRTGDAKHPQDVGLVFEPSGSRRASADGALRTDVRGVLWVDGLTSELHTLEFTYTGLPFGVAESHANGHVDFLRLPGGAVVVREWVIRAPDMEEIREGSWMPTEAEMRVKVVGLRETSGEIVEASTLDRRALWRAQGATLAGVVIDSERRLPVQGAVVGIAGTAYHTVTDADGRWRLDGLPSGPHPLFVSTRVFELLGASPDTRVVTLRDRATDTLQLALTPERALVARICGDTLRARTTSVVAGTARDSVSGVALSGATVRVWSTTQTLATAGRIARPVFEAEFVTDSAGAFHICGAPNDARLALRARLGNRRSGMSPVETAQTSIVIQDALVGKRLAIVSP